MTDVYGTQEQKISEFSPDDLTEIKGIGSTTAEKLYNAKIVSIRQIAKMTPEKLSETPGIGLATAAKFITAAKNHLESSPKEEIVSESIQIQGKIKVESTPTTIEQDEVEQIIVDDIQEASEELQTEREEELDQLQTDPKWFSDKYSYSRLTASYPPKSESVKNASNAVKEDEAEMIDIESKTIQMPENIEFGTQPEIEQVSEFEEESSQEIIPEIRIERDQLEQKNRIEEESVEFTYTEPKNIDFEYSRDSTFESIIQQQISDTFKDAGCYEIPGSLESLKLFTTGLDYLGCKLVKASDDLRILFLFPVKRFDGEGTVLVNESKIELKSYSSKTDLGAYYDIEQIVKNLLHVRDLMYEDLATNQNILTFFQKYLQITLSLEKGFGNKSAIFLSGTTQYKVFIEPILLCYNPPRSMEKSLTFPYQRSSNLHAVTRTDLAPLVKFLEKKYRMIEKRTKKTNSVIEHRQAEETLKVSVRYVSIPIFGYSVALLVIYFAELYFLLRLFNTIGFAVIGIYIALLTFFYFNFYRTKKRLTTQFKTPYYLQKFEFSEIDFLDFKEELTDELLTQFGYECMRKDVNFGVLEQSETNTLKRRVEEKRSEPKFQNLFEVEREKAESISNLTPKYGSKYLSFLEDP